MMVVLEVKSFCLIYFQVFQGLISWLTKFWMSQMNCKLDGELGGQGMLTHGSLKMRQ